MSFQFYVIFVFVALGIETDAIVVAVYKCDELNVAMRICVVYYILVERLVLYVPVGSLNFYTRTKYVTQLDKFSSSTVGIIVI